MRVVLSSNPYRDKGLRAGLEAKRILDKSGVEAILCLPFTPKKGERLDVPPYLKLVPLEQALKGADMLLCFGGDGTILHAARDVLEQDIPILGVNLGSVGFMAELERNELPLLTALSRNQYTLEERMMLQVRVYRGERLIHEEIALNDAVFSKGSMARVSELEVWADQALCQQVTGDGVIVATPTGSTAYSMSAGGPIVEPTSQGLVVTPVCAHQLAVRAMVLDANRKLTVRLPKGNRKTIFLSIDGGKAIRLGSHERVEIVKAEKTTKLVRLTGRSFYQRIHEKLGGSHL